MTFNDGWYTVEVADPSNMDGHLKAAELGCYWYMLKRVRPDIAEWLDDNAHEPVKLLIHFDDRLIQTHTPLGAQQIQCISMDIIYISFRSEVEAVHFKLAFG